MIDPAEYTAGLPAPHPVPVTSYNPMTFDIPGRPMPLSMRVTTPVSGTDLPVLVLSHGHGNSHFLASQYGYGPLVEFFAAHGFVVIQPTHLSSKMLQQPPTAGGPLFLKSRGEDIRHTIDHLDTIESTVPALRGRIDQTRIAAVGHSLGAHTIGLVSGMTTQDIDGTTMRPIDDRISARVLIAAPGSGIGLAPAARKRMPQLGTVTFDTMTPDALVVIGENDHNPFFTDRPTWRADAYNDSPGPKTLLTMLGAEHLFGGISGYDAAETTDENPDRVATLRTLVWAYVHSTLYPADKAWPDAVAAATASGSPSVRVESKP